MKRYTARLRLLDSQLNTAQIKAAVETELLRAPITFKVGAVALTEGNVALVEIASGEKRPALARRLKGLESKYPLQLECVGWGWPVSGAAIKSAGEAPSGEHDPCTTMQAQVEDTREYALANTRQFVAKQAIKLILLIGFVAIPVLAALGVLNGVSAMGILNGVNCIMAAMYPALFFSGAFSILWTFPTWASCIRCDPTGIEVRYLLRSSPRRWTWAEIEELGMTTLAFNRAHIIRSRKISLKFSIEDFNEQPTLIKTILERASLNFVEGSIGAVSYTYKRFDAE
jgi:hypothetical protein